MVHDRLEGSARDSLDVRRPQGGGCRTRAAAPSPATRGPQTLLAMQRVAGNQAVVQLLAARRASAVPVPAAGAGRTNETGLPAPLKAGIEQLSGVSLDDVRVSYNSPAPAELQALAFTRGREIHVAPGQERHLPHEAWHVVQQKQGRVAATVQAKSGVAINDNGGLEREADIMGARALAGGPSALSAAPMATSKTAPSNPDNRSPVTQLASTHLTFGGNVTGESRIAAAQHTRGPVHTSAANWVFGEHEWTSVPDRTVINHSKPYADIDQHILDVTHNEKLKKASKYLLDTHRYLVKRNHGVDIPMAKHQRSLQDVVDDPSDEVVTDDITDAFNYFIYKIGDYPKNLFVWPDKTHANPDEPTGAYGDANAPHKDWKVANSIISNSRRLNVAKKRLKEGRNDLDQALVW